MLSCLDLNNFHSGVPDIGTYRVSQKYCLLKMLTKENLLAIDCKHVLRTVSVLTFGSFTLYNFNLTIVYFSKKLFRSFKKIV